jgi:amino acid transporter
MTDSSTTSVAGTSQAVAAKLEPDAIGVVQDTVIGMASSAPAGTVAATLAVLAAATAYGSGLIIIVTAIPMLIIANAYRRLNMWNANCGASFEWVGRAISPYLGFLTGWLMVAGYIIGTVAEVVVLGPSVLAVFGSSSAGTWAYIAIASGVVLVMLVIAIVGIRITARAQISMAVVEYAILIGFSVVGLAAVLGHHLGTFPITRGWLSLSGIGGKGSMVAGLLIAVYVYSAWDGTVYVNEEVKHRRTNPGRAALWAVALLTVLYSLAQVGLQGVVSPARLQGHASSALIYAAQALGGSGWAKVMALSIALSVIATTGTGIVLTARIVYGMASYRALPEFLGTVSRRFSTPVAASVVAGLFIVAVTWVYLLATSVQNVFGDVVDVAGLLFSMFYIMTALATVVYYRRRIFTTAWDLLVLGILPLAAAAFLGWVVVKSLQSAPPAQIWSVTAIVAVGLVLMLVARFILRSPFFQIERESYIPGQSRHRAQAGER